MLSKIKNFLIVLGLSTISFVGLFFFFFKKDKESSKLDQTIVDNNNKIEYTNSKIKEEENFRKELEEIRDEEVTKEDSLEDINRYINNTGLSR